MKTLLLLATLLLMQQETPKVAYICLSKTSEVYHLKSDCSALKRCTHEVVKTNEQEAKEKYGKLRVCGFED